MQWIGPLVVGAEQQLEWAVKGSSSSSPVVVVAVEGEERGAVEEGTLVVEEAVLLVLEGELWVCRRPIVRQHLYQHLRVPSNSSQLQHLSPLVLSCSSCTGGLTTTWGHINHPSLLSQ